MKHYTPKGKKERCSLLDKRLKEILTIPYWEKDHSKIYYFLKKYKSFYDPRKMMGTDSSERHYFFKERDLLVKITDVHSGFMIVFTQTRIYSNKDDEKTRKKILRYLLKGDKEIDEKVKKYDAEKVKEELNKRIEETSRKVSEKFPQKKHFKFKIKLPFHLSVFIIAILLILIGLLSQLSLLYKIGGAIILAYVIFMILWGLWIIFLRLKFKDRKA